MKQMKKSQIISKNVLSAKTRHRDKIFIFWHLIRIRLHRVMLLYTHLWGNHSYYAVPIILVPSTILYSRLNEHALYTVINTFYVAQVETRIRAQPPDYATEPNWSFSFGNDEVHLKMSRWKTIYQTPIKNY